MLQRRGFGSLGLYQTTSDGIAIYGGTPPYAEGGTGHSTRDAILGTINNLVPSIISAFGRNPYPLQNQGYQQTYDQYGNQQSPGSAVSQGIGTGLAASLQSLSNFFGVSSTTLLIGGGVGLYLLFRPPPRRR